MQIRTISIKELPYIKNTPDVELDNTVLLLGSNIL